MSKGFAIQTKNGNMFDPKTGHLDVIDIDDIAHALSNISRYAGHCRSFYSVAEHSVLVSRITRKLWPDDIDTIWAGLLHDATEAYITDLPTPLKVLLPQYIKIEDALTVKIARKFKIRWNKRIVQRVKIADLVALSTEARLLFANVDHWDIIKEYEPVNSLLNKNFPVGPGTAKGLFLREFRRVQKEKGYE